jgi:soluble lytic murein transglycosylase-like protein
VFLAPLTAACLATAAHAYHLPETHLYAIMRTEGGQVGQAVRNTNGTYDLGPFQINSSWGPAIGRYWHVSAPIALQHVRDNGCANAMIASAILKKMLIETKGDLPKAIGYYHSHTPALAAQYRTIVLGKAETYTQAAVKARKTGRSLPPTPTLRAATK